ncbi:MAG: tRNA (adenosine(37)-N6)-threonylcarbamoyltransferase complex transferase subunit TsaD [Bacteriovoracaceae bacterium]|nr:tRNA (adenosine(37)-N6)-threonylcarbamoyltransferase complex transferase subunit TsaD [Bacteriovoracaceae bacterium]
MKIVLGIETSCDDTSICILKGDVNSDEFPQILAHKSFSQEIMLAKWGGVVPEIAARNHLAKVAPLLDQVFKEAQLTPSEIDLIGVTTHPGLLGPLLTGLNGAKTISLLHHQPIVAVNHLYAHLEAIHLTTKISYPYLGLIVSGGHSLYMLVRSSTEMEILGTTIDDAAGEAFDKGGKLMGIGHPGGKLIDDMAKKGNDRRYEFPIGLTGSKDANLSYSGVKTSLRQMLEKNPHLVTDTPGDIQSQDMYDLCASYQRAIIRALCKKLGFAYKMAKEKIGSDLPIVVGGGVAANSALRALLQSEYKDVNFVKMSYCTDNGAMVANYALLNMELSVPFPECLYLDARGRFIDKKKGIKR